MIAKKESLLIVEENPVIQSLFQETFQRRGYEVFQAPSPDQGIELYRSGPTDLVLTNITFKNGNGLAFVENLKRFDSDVAVIVLATHLDLDLARKSIAYGIYDFIPIPFELDQVVSAVLKAFEKKMLLERNKALIEHQAQLIERLHSSFKRLKELDKLKTEFLVTVSHELMTPLTAIKSLTYNLYRGVLGELDEKQKEYAQLIEENADRLENILRDILDFSKLEAGKIGLRKQDIDIRGVIKKVQRMMNPLAAQKGVSIKMNGGNSLPAVSVDPARMEEVLMNLVENAIKFTPAPGSIDIVTKEETDSVTVQVRDTGIGIPQEHLNKVFSQFTQFHREYGPGAQGTGLGLAIVKKLVEMHGGIIWVESKVKKGTTFTFTIPKKAPAAAAG
jgi:signal transduction histidine kinase